MKEKLSNGITGIAGEYFVAAELSIRGFMASVTLRNNESIDIHATKISNNDKMFAIQVKTSQINNRKWILNKKSETYNFVQQRQITLNPFTINIIWKNLDIDQEIILGYNETNETNETKNKI